MDWTSAASGGLERGKNGFSGWLEVLAGPTGRRDWPDEIKARIVRESFEAGERVCDVARRHGILPQQLTGWRRAARQGRLALPLNDGEPGFVPLMVDDEDRRAVSRCENPDEPVGVIEIELAGMVLRLPSQTAPSRIAAVVLALRSSA